MKTLNGQSIKKLFISGSNNLYNYHQEIDALNVFPVPDGDTGMNMNLTLTSGCKELAEIDDKNIYNVAKKFSHGLLLGARGNSGVITSQIFRGFAEGLENKETVSAMELAEAFKNGVKVAYKAVIKPVEGTILTVARESADTLMSLVRPTMSIERAFDILIKEANDSLQRTPNLLPILKEAGVIDSGGAGYIKILDGMRYACDHDIIQRKTQEEMEKGAPLVAAGASLEEEEFGYCTEFIMELGPDAVKKPFNQSEFTQDLEKQGNSLVVVRDEEIVKVHVHTLEPGSVLNYAQQYGEFLKLKIENMTEQHHALATGKEVNTTPDLVPEPEKQLEKTTNAIIAVSCGSGVDDLFKELGVKIVVKGGQTMNPSSEDFVSAIKRANADNIFILPNNSNIVLAARQAKELCDDLANIYIVPSKTVLQGLSAVGLFDFEGDPEGNFAQLNEAINNVKSGEITFAIRDTSIDGVKVKKDDFIGIYDKNLVVDCKDKAKAAEELLDKMIDEDNDSIITLLIGDSVTREEKEKVLNYINEKYPDLDVDVRDGNQPVYSFLIGVE